MKTLVSWKKRKELEKINHLGPKQPLSLFGPNVVGLQWLVASVNVGVGMGVVMADSDNGVVVPVVVVREGGIVINGGGKDYTFEQGLEEQQKRNVKKRVKIMIFLKVREGFNPSKMLIFRFILDLILMFIFEKWDSKWNKKWAKNGPKMVAVDNPNAVRKAKKMVMLMWLLRNVHHTKMGSCNTCCHKRNYYGGMTIAQHLETYKSEKGYFNFGVLT
jgi:hypothetical protein